MDPLTCAGSVKTLSKTISRRSNALRLFGLRVRTPRRLLSARSARTCEALKTFGFFPAVSNAAARGFFC